MVVTNELPTTSYALLGLLAMGPMSGYDLDGFVSRSIANFWPIEKSQIYRELTRLEALGFLEATEVAQQGAPDKRVYALTGAGERALDDWLAESTYQQERVRNAFLVKLFFGWRMPPDRLGALVEQYRVDALAERDRLRGIVDRLADAPGAAFGRATASFGLRHAESTLQWCDEMRAALPELYGQAARTGRSRPRPAELVVTSPE
jgi:PadR family transcriptional regulator, regulatory protein AphA